MLSGCILGLCRGESQAKICKPQRDRSMGISSLRRLMTFASWRRKSQKLQRDFGAQEAETASGRGTRDLGFGTGTGMRDSGWGFGMRGSGSGIRDSVLPSPIAHGLAGVAAGWIVDPPPHGDRSAAWIRVALFVAAGVAADLDLLAGAHSGPTHGLGAAVLVGVAVWVCSAGLQASQSGHDVDGKAGLKASATRRFALAVAAAYASHTLLDWLGSDTRAPVGIMALWPFSRDYYESRLHVFMAISRRYWLGEFWTYNLRALARELVILLPLVAAVVLFRRRAGRASGGPPSRPCRPSGSSPRRP
jgi:LexA-binding, inner membrane-associated putative hydrolase